MIYCVEDDAAIRELEVYALTAAGFEARGFVDGDSFLHALDEQLPALAILDVMLPDTDGLTLLKRLRAGARTAQLPVMMASAKGTEYDKVLGLDSGADDYIAKPFGMTELVSRVRALLRRSGEAPPKSEMLRLGNLIIDDGAHRVTVSGEEILLTNKEYQTLYTLMRHAGQVFTRDKLLNAVWGYDFDGETRTVDVHMRSLRQKLGAAGAMVETVRGVGYRIRQE